MSVEQKSQIIAAEYYLPSKKMTAREMGEITGVGENVIIDKIGIREKRIAAADEHPSDLAVKAGKKALSGIDPSSIDVVIYCGATPVDYLFWVCAHKIQAELKLVNAYVFDLHAICAGTVYAINTAKSLIAADKTINRVFICAGEKFSSICSVDTYKNLSALRYADAGGAMIVERGCRYNEILSSCFVSQGELNHFVKIPAGGTVNPPSINSIADGKHCLLCEDTEKLKEVFSKNYVKNYKHVINTSLKKSGIADNKFDHLIINQTDHKSTQQIFKEMNISEENTISTREKLGHVGSVDQIMIFNMLMKSGRLKRNDIIVMASSGIGFSWGAVAVKYKQNY